MSERLNDREYRRLMSDDKVRQAMKIRCEEDRHEYVGAMTMLFQIYRECKWCGEQR